VILIKNIYTLWGRKRFLMPVTYFLTNLVYPFTLRVTGIKIYILYYATSSMAGGETRLFLLFCSMFTYRMHTVRSVTH